MPIGPEQNGKPSNIQTGQPENRPGDYWNRARVADSMHRPDLARPLYDKAFAALKRRGQ